MPNPKVGTVTPDVASAVSAAKNGEVQFKAEKSGVVQVGIGKASFDKKKLSELRSPTMTSNSQHELQEPETRNVEDAFFSSPRKK